MGKQRSLERSIQEGLLKSIPVETQIYDRIGRQEKDNTTKLIDFLKTNKAVDSPSNQMSKLFKPGMFSPQSTFYKKNQIEELNAALPEINATESYYKSPSKPSPFGLYPDPSQPQNPDYLNNKLSQSRTLRDFFKPSVKCYYGDEFQRKYYHQIYKSVIDYMGENIELGDPRIIRHNIDKFEKT